MTSTHADHPHTGPLLAIETATKTARVGLFDAQGQALALAEQTADRHSAGLLTLCDQLFQQTNLTPKDLAAIACGAGPGSFTGLRVGLALSKGLALPFHTPLVLRSSLHTLACDLVLLPQAQGVAWLIPCIDAGKGEVHAQIFANAPRASHSQESALRLTPADLIRHLAVLNPAPWLLAGPELAKFPDLAALANNGSPLTTAVLDAPGPSAVALAALARDAIANGQLEDLASSAPAYGRLPDITQPRRKIVGPGPPR